MSDFLKNHVSFSSGYEIYQICKPILEAFQFAHFTYCRKFRDGSRAILTTTYESFYDLYVNKKYIFSPQYNCESQSLNWEDFIGGVNSIQCEFRSDFLNLYLKNLEI